MRRKRQARRPCAGCNIRARARGRIHAGAHADFRADAGADFQAHARQKVIYRFSCQLKLSA